MEVTDVGRSVARKKPLIGPSKGGHSRMSDTERKQGGLLPPPHISGAAGDTIPQWSRAAGYKRTKSSWRTHRDLHTTQKGNEVMGSTLSPRVCNVIFPRSKMPLSTGKMTFRNATSSSPLEGVHPRESDRNLYNHSCCGNSSSIGGVIPQSRSMPLTSNVKEDPRIYRQSGFNPPRPEALLVHPHGFRILKNKSAMERSMRNYFRLPPAPSSRLIVERMRAQRQLLAVDMAEDAEEARFFGASLSDSLQQRHFASLKEQPRMLLDGFLLLCAGEQSEPEAVEVVTLQSSHLVGVIRDDLIHFQNLRFLDVSENELLLEDLLFFTGLEVLHLAYNKIKSLAGVSKVVHGQHQQVRPQETVESSIPYDNCNGAGSNDIDVNRISTRDDPTVPVSAMHYAPDELKTGVPLDGESRFRTPITPSQKKDTYSNGGESIEYSNDVRYFVPHRSTTRRTKHSSECGAHDVLLPNLHALNLSFNNVPPGDILHLSYFPFLEKLDLSRNNLRMLPEDLAGLTSVTHLALEGNLFRNSQNIFSALSTMPALIEVNLNYNELRHVPVLSVNDGYGLCFPTIEVIGLCHNRIESAQSITPLSELVRTLHRVVLVGNPIARKGKERNLARMHFSQAVLKFHWEHTGLRTSRGVFHSSTDHLHTKPPTGIGSIRVPGEEYEDDADKEVVLDALNHAGKDSGDISLWNFHHGRPRRHSLESQTALPCPSKKSHDENSMASESSVDYHDTNSSNNIENSDSGKGAGEDMTFSDLIPRKGMHAERRTTLTDLNNTSDNYFCSYGDGSQFPACHTSGVDGEEEPPFLSTESPMRFVELVFEDTAMPKQTTGYFYAKKRQLATETTADEAPPSSMVHPKTGLVTLPNYNEFMDIYRIVGDTSQLRRRTQRRPYATVRKERNRMADIVLPPRKEETEEDESEAEDAPEAETTKPRGCNGMYDDDPRSLSNESISSRDVVFMTGVALNGDARERRRERKSSVQSVQEYCSEPELRGSGGAVHDDTPNPNESMKARKGVHMAREKEQPTRQHGRQKHPSNVGKEQNRVAFAAEPSKVNVRILMNELRRMLHRPLPPLPPSTTRRVTYAKTDVL